MGTAILISVIDRVIQLFSLIVVINAILSYFLAPYHPAREMLDRFLEPFLAPIRRVLPPMGNIDFSPLVLIILLQVLDSILVTFLRQL